MSDGDLTDLAARMWAQLGAAQRASAELLCASVAAVEAGDRAAWATVRELAHRLAGTLGTLGQHVAGAEAVALEDATSGVVDPDGPLVEEVAARAEALLAALPDAGDPAVGPGGA